MCNKSISFTIPLVAGILLRTARMLEELAAECGAPSRPVADCYVGEKSPVESTLVDIPQEQPEVCNHGRTWTGPDGEVCYFCGTIVAEPPSAAEAFKDVVIDAGAAFGVPTNVVPPPGNKPAGFEPDLTSCSPYGCPPIPAATVTPPGTGVELDNRGLPWDQRIHASTKTKCKTGEWKNARSVDPALLQQVEAELRSAMAGIPIIVPPTFPAIPAEPAVPSPVTDAPPVPPADTLPPTAFTPADCPASFPEFLQIVTAKCSARVLTYDEVTKTCQKHGLSGIPLLNARPDLIPTIYAELEAIWTARTVA